MRNVLLRIEWVFRRWVAPRTVMYRPEYFNGAPNGISSYELGHLRAKVRWWNVRLPMKWAYENLIVCEKLGYLK